MVHSLSRPRFRPLWHIAEGVASTLPPTLLSQRLHISDCASSYADSASRGRKAYQTRWLRKLERRCFSSEQIDRGLLREVGAHVSH